MKIALLAPSGAGKTVYLSGLYGVLTQELSNSDYGINFEVTDRRLNAALDNRYTKLVEDHEFGGGTETIDTYPLSLSIPSRSDASKELSVEIVDFPGGFLHQATEDNLQQVESTIQALSECDGFVVLLDGDALIKSADKKDPRSLQSKLKPHAVQIVLNAALERRRTRVAAQLLGPDEYAFGSGPTPVVFGVTKGDKIAQWLSANPDQAVEKLEKTVRGAFALKASAQPGYDPNESVVANFVRSQFRSIIDAPDVVSLRTAVCVYDEAEEVIDPRNVEHLFQFVLFSGLYNAHEEYGERRRQWQQEEKRRSDQFSDEKRYYEGAVSARADWKRKDVIDRLVAWWETDESIERHDEKVSRYHRDMEKAAQSLDSGKEFLLRVSENYFTAQEFLRRILPNRSAYLLTHGTGKERLYQKNLPLGELGQKAWWKEKVEAGRLEIEQGLGSERDLSL